MRPGWTLSKDPGSSANVVTTGGGESSRDEVYSWVFDPTRYAQIASYMLSRGLQVRNFEDVRQLWAAALDNANAAYEGSNKRLKQSPWDVIDLMAHGDQSGGAAGAAGPIEPWRGLEYSETSTHKNIVDMAPETARALIDNTLTEFLGRKANDEEIEDFASRANAIVSANPQITKSTSHREWDPNLNGPGQGGYKETGTTTRQIGPSAEDVGNKVEQNAIDRAMNDPEYDEMYSSMVLYNALVEAISAPV
jgi:hypothetical protein